MEPRLKRSQIKEDCLDLSKITESNHKECSNRMIVAIQSIIDLSDEIGAKKALAMIKILVN